MQGASTAREGTDIQINNTFMNALKNSTGSVDSQSYKQTLPNDATFINALKQSTGSVGSVESSSNMGALKLYDNYMQIAN